MNITQLPIDALKPNDYNPNRQDDDEFAENVAEVRRLGRLPKPIVVRRDADDGTYIIVDGEHAWRAAKEVGIVEVPCEVVDVDDFEAKLLTYKRNCGGTNNPVRLGQMFRAMQAERELSLRQLEKEINVPESTIRSYLSYAEASDLRAKHNPEDCVDEVAEMAHREVRAYLDIGDELRDKWFDAGHDMRWLDALYEGNAHRLEGQIRKSGLGYIVEAGRQRFRPSLEFALALADWREAHKTMTDVDAYIRPVAYLRIGDDQDFPPVKLLDLLPCRKEAGCATVALPVEKWASILTDAAARTDDEDGLVALVEKGVKVALKQAGVDPGDTLGPEVAEALLAVADAPAYIRDAEWLTLVEQAWLTTTEFEAPDELVAQAKELTCQTMQQLRSAAEANCPDACNATCGSIAEVLNHHLVTLVGQRRRAALDEVFANRDRLSQAVLAKLTAAESVSSVMIDQRPAMDVLAERLRALPPPELALVAASVLTSSALDDVAARWLAAVTVSDGNRPIA